jgi:hypothetical protein
MLNRPSKRLVIAIGICSAMSLILVRLVGRDFPLSIASSKFGTHPASTSKEPTPSSAPFSTVQSPNIDVEVYQKQIAGTQSPVCTPQNEVVRESTAPEPVKLDQLPLPFSLRLNSTGDSSETNIHKTMIAIMKGVTSSKLEDYTYVQTISKYVCDKSTQGRCDIRLKSDYTYDVLGHKTKEFLDALCTSKKDLPELLIKIDDDSIIGKNELNLLINDFMASTCIYGGPMGGYSKPYVWAQGSFYLIKRAGLERICARDRKIIEDLGGDHEDVYVGYLLDIASSDLACEIGGYTAWHKEYSDNRVKIQYDVNH